MIMAIDSASPPDRQDTSQTVTHCQICEQACAAVVTATQDRIVSVEPDRTQTYWRDFCIKGAKAGMVRDHQLRLKSPMRREGDRWVSATNDVAIEGIASVLERIRHNHGPDALGSYTGNPNGLSLSNSGFHNGFMTAYVGLYGLAGHTNHQQVDSLLIEQISPRGS